MTLFMLSLLASSSPALATCTADCLEEAAVWVWATPACLEAPWEADCRCDCASSETTYETGAPCNDTGTTGVSGATGDTGATADACVFSDWECTEYDYSSCGGGSGRGPASALGCGCATGPSPAGAAFGLAGLLGLLAAGRRSAR